jgi:hypothetical protein
MAIVRAIAADRTSMFEVDRHDLLGMSLSAALPVAVFVIANGLAEINGAMPLFFSPFGLPGWLGGALHIGTLPLLGAARWMVVDRSEAGRSAGWWIVALMAGLIVFPFIVAPLDSLMLSIVSMSLLVIGVAAIARTSAVSRTAAWLMAPGLLWIAFGAFIGLSFVAAWAPPFGLTHGNQAAS